MCLAISSIVVLWKPNFEKYFEAEFTIRFLTLISDIIFDYFDFQVKFTSFLIVISIKRQDADK